MKVIKGMLKEELENSLAMEKTMKENWQNYPKALR